MSNIKINKRLILSAILSASLSTGFLAGYNPAEAAYRAPSIDYLQTKDDGTVLGDYYVPSTLDNVFWGKIPSRNDKAIIHIPSGSTVTIDTVSHEGILEDQGKDPVKYFGQYGITPDHVMQDAINIAANKKGHDFDTNGPHVITGPIYVDGAEPGDVLKVEVIALEPRVPYGVVTNRHFKGTIPDEMPETPRLENPSSEHPESYGNVSVFTSIQKKGDNNEWFGIMQNNGQIIQFPLNPFLLSDSESGGSTSLKQVSSDLGITPQAIYKQKEELQNKGYMIKNSSNDWEITSDGYNYLKEKQINRFKRNNISLKENDIKSTNLQGKEENNSLNETLINFYETRLEEIKQSYENQLNEQKKQVEYFKNLYEEEKSERIRANAQYQTYLLGTAEDNKRHWWQFWNKTNKERDN